jgi:CRP-like cAMP-binding protein
VKPAANALLAALPRKDYARLLPALAPVTLKFGEILYEPKQPIPYVYFPIDSLVSLLVPTDGHQLLEVGMVGHEGMVGASIALGMPSSSLHALVQGGGSALRMSANRFRGELDSCPPFQRLVNRHLHALMAQISETAACNHFHVVEARLARWLLMTRDRMRSAEFRMTHEFLAQMLGVRRVGVTEAAGALQAIKLIEYARGQIRILDSPGLEAACCGCYVAPAGAARPAVG